MASEGQMLQKQSYKPILITVFVIVLSVGGFAVWQARPLYEWVQTQRALLKLDRINECIEEERWAEGFQIGFEAYHMAPEEPKVLRALSRLTMARQSPEALVLLKQIVELGADTYEDRLLLSKANLRQGYVDASEELNRRLIKERPDDPRVLDLEVDVRMQRKDYRGAIELLKILLPLRPDDVEKKFMLARLFIAKGTDNEKEQGIRHLLVVGQDPSETGLQAIELLARGEGFSTELNEVLIKIIRAHPLAEEKHLLIADERSLLIYPDKRDEIIKQALESRDPEDRRELALLYRFLSKEKEYALIVENLTLDVAREDGELSVIYVNALGNQGQWEKVRELLTKENLPIEEARRQIFAAICAQKLGEDTTVMEGHLHVALRAAQRRGNYREALNAGTYAETMGLEEIAETAYQVAQRSERVAEKAFQSLVRLAEKQEDTAKMREITRRYYFRYPQRSEVNERYLYLNALLGIEVESSLYYALKLVEEEPFRNTPRIIAALAYYRINDVPKAAEITKSCKLPQMTPGEKAVYAAIAGAVENGDLASQISGTLLEDELLEEERRLVSAWLPPAPADPAPAAVSGEG